MDRLGTDGLLTAVSQLPRYLTAGIRWRAWRFATIFTGATVVVFRRAGRGGPGE